MTTQPKKPTPRSSSTFGLQTDSVKSAVAKASDVLQASDPQVYQPTRPGDQKLSISNYEVAPQRIFEQLFGRKLETNESGVTMVPGVNCDSLARQPGSG